MAFLAGPFFVCAGSNFVDSWPLPERTSFFSQNKQFRFDVIPTVIEDQLSYWTDKRDGAERPGVREIRESNRARGVLLALKGRSRYRVIASFDLLNEVAPVTVLVTNDGQHVVTFDDWHHVGYGPNVVVIYRSDGTVIRNFALTDLATQQDIDLYSHSISSIVWRLNQSLMREPGFLILNLPRCRVQSRNSKQPSAKLQIRLSDGHLIEEVVDRIAFVGVVRISDASYDEHYPFRNKHGTECVVDGDQDDPLQMVTTDELVARILDAPLPPFPMKWARIRLRGEMTLDIGVSATGNVMCIGWVSPINIAGAMQEIEACVRALCFEPKVIDGIAVPFMGRLSIEYQLKGCDS